MRFVPGEDAGHHTRDGCAPRTLGFDRYIMGSALL